MLSNRFIFILLSFSFSLPLYTQNLKDEAAFFKSQAITYQKWMEDSGFNNLLDLKDLVIEDNRVYLFLGFNNEDIDYVWSAWNTLKESFENVNTITLEQNLFYKAVHFMQVDQEQIQIEIYDTYDLSRSNLFEILIYFEDGVVKEEKNFDKAIRKVVSVPKPNFVLDHNIMNEKLIKREEKRIIFDRILAGAREYYSQESKKTPKRTPTFKEISKLDNLRFEVANLTNEVVTDASQSLFCGLFRKLGFNCDWRPREVLTFTITYTEEGDELLCSITVDGRLGSGVYEEARRTSYISLEVEHYSALDVYVESIREKIYNWISMKP